MKEEEEKEEYANTRKGDANHLFHALGQLHTHNKWLIFLSSVWAKRARNQDKDMFASPPCQQVYFCCSEPTENQLFALTQK